uniref:Uncharacterized protein n=1 Tax=Rhizophora mucronata TaxID=61149 RepID=A0A2P2QJW1_RHIMU
MLPFHFLNYLKS